MTDSAAQHDGPALPEIRAAIDVLDRRIIDLIAERQAWVEAAGRAKRGEPSDAVRAPDRVQQVIDRVRGHAAAAGASPAVVEASYRAMIGAFVELELGVHGRA